MVLIEIDGSPGDSGGQILRTSLTLAVCLGKPIAIRNFRADCARPGLRPQHLPIVRALVDICDAEVDADAEAEDVQVGHRSLVFAPRGIRSGAYSIDAGALGPTSLVLQALALPLAMAEDMAIVKIVGGTHSLGAPCFEFLAHVWVPFMRQIGVAMSVGISRAGFYPHGEGIVAAQITGGLKQSGLQAIDITERGEMRSLKGTVRIANHSMSIGHRLKEAACSQLERKEVGPVDIGVDLIEATDPGGYCSLNAVFDHARATFVGITKSGKSPESAGAEVATAMAEFIGPDQEQTGAFDPYLADQAMVALSLAPGTSRYTTSRITQHCLTNAAVIETITGRKITIEGQENEPGLITIN